MLELQQQLLLSEGEGEHPSFTDQAITESWNGSSWTEINDLNTARKAIAGFGTQTAALAAGGQPGNTTNTETWDGSSWTEVNNLNNGRSCKGTGISTAGLAFGGGPPTPTYPKAEEWDGTSWTEVTDMSTPRGNAGGFGTYRDAIVCGGYSTRFSWFYDKRGKLGRIKLDRTSKFNYC